MIIGTTMMAVSTNWESLLWVSYLGYEAPGFLEATI